MLTGVSCQTDISQNGLDNDHNELHSESCVLQDEIKGLKLQISKLQTSISKSSISEATLKEDSEFYMGKYVL